MTGELRNKIDTLWTPSGGPEDLFADKDVDEIVAVLHQVRATAIPVAS